MTHLPTNIQRAAKAKQAMAAFIEATIIAAVEAMHPEDLRDAISGLICDLLHLANQNSLHPESIIAQAQTHYDVELMEAQS